MTEAMPCPDEETQFGRTMSVHELTGVRDRHRVVFFAVHHQHWSRGEPSGRCNGTEAAEFSRPFVGARRELRLLDRADLTSMLEKPARVFGHASENPFEPNRSFIPGISKTADSGSRSALQALLAERGKCVPAVAGFGERVGAETGCDTLLDELVDHLVVTPRLEVVHKLCALVPRNRLSSNFG